MCVFFCVVEVHSILCTCPYGVFVVARVCVFVSVSCLSKKKSESLCVSCIRSACFVKICLIFSKCISTPSSQVSHRNPLSRTSPRRAVRVRYP